MNYRYCLGQDGLALQRNVDTLLLAVKQADGCEPRHVRCDRKRKRSFSGLRYATTGVWCCSLCCLCALCLRTCLVKSHVKSRSLDLNSKRFFSFFVACSLFGWTSKERANSFLVLLPLGSWGLRLRWFCRLVAACSYRNSYNS